MTAPEAYIKYSTDVFTGSVADETTEEFPANFMTEFRDHIVRVRTVLPRQADTARTQ